ncbi:MAG: TolC family protein [Bacteroidota bacterium]
MKKILLYLFLTINISHAQTLEMLTQKGFEQNLDLQILETQYLAALERAPQVRQLKPLEMDAGGFPLPIQTRLGPQALRIGAMQKFPWWGTLEQQGNLELAKAKALFERMAVRALDLKYEIAQAYFQLYELLEKQKITERKLDLLESLERVALAKVESGKATAAAVLKVQLETADVKQELNILKQLEKKPKIMINQLLNRALDVPIQMPTQLELATIEWDKGAIENHISAQHPILKRYRLQQEIAQSELIVNDLSNKPSFGIGVDYIFINNRTDINFLDNGRDALQVRATLSLPIYRKQHEAKKREEQLKIATLDQQKANSLHQFLATIEQAFVDHENAQLRLTLYQKQQNITQSMIRILEANYSTANSDFEELLRLEKELIHYDLKILQAIVQSHLAKSEISRYIDDSRWR